MNLAACTIRRATLEDLDCLRMLWQEARLPVANLEKRFTEFKVVVNDKGAILGALGLQVIGQQGWLHSEAFLYPEFVEALRPRFWERVQVVAHNFSLVRFWTLEDSPFWRHFAGFREPTAHDLLQLPVAFGTHQQHWLTLPLRETSQPAIDVDEQLKVLQEEHQEATEKMLRRARQFRRLATFLAVVLFTLVVLAGIYVLKHLRTTPSP